MADCIKLFTTQGCEGCDIIKNLISKAIKETHAEKVEYDIIDCLNPEYKQFLKYHEVEDFPATFFISEGQVKNIILGTATSDIIAREIKKWFDI